jgi:hypothetical protein
MRVMTRLSMLLLSLACAATRLSAQSYVGTWALVLVDKVSPDGTHTHLYGDDPQGLMTLDAEGRYTIQILRTGRAKFASGSKATGTPEENQQAVRGNSSEFGRYAVGELTVVGDRLTFIQPTTSANDGSKGEVTWRRLDSPSLAGVWTLTVADEIRPDGSRVHAYGEHPEGQLILDPSGHYSVFVFRTPHTKFASGEKSRGTADEYEAATKEMSAHYGRYAVDAASHTLTFDIERSSFPNLDGVEQKRPYQLVGDDLTYRIPPRADGTISISSWHRSVR